jgi:hypothetical protein
MSVEISNETAETSHQALLLDAGGRKIRRSSRGRPMLIMLRYSVVPRSFESKERPSGRAKLMADPGVQTVASSGERLSLKKVTEGEGKR